MDRSGLQTRGLQPALRTSLPPFPRDGEGVLPPRLFRPFRPTALDAATRGTHGRLPPQFSSGLLSPHLRRGYANARLRLRSYGAEGQHPSACQANHLRFTPRRTTGYRLTREVNG
jgi:hypothetical protein